MRDAFNLAKDNSDKIRAAWVDAMRLPSSGDASAPKIPTRMAPPTPFNKSITPHRRFAYRSYRLADIKKVKNHYGVTVNDVVMALCGGALRRYLDRHEALTDQPLVAAVPVSIRTGDEEDMWTNRVSSVFAQIPTHLDDPGERMQFQHDAMSAAKGSLS